MCIYINTTKGIAVATTSTHPHTSRRSSSQRCGFWGLKIICWVPSRSRRGSARSVRAHLQGIEVYEQNILRGPNNALRGGPKCEVQGSSLRGRSSEVREESQIEYDPASGVTLEYSSTLDNYTTMCHHFEAAVIIMGFSAYLHVQAPILYLSAFGPRLRYHSTLRQQQLGGGHSSMEKASQGPLKY